MSFYPCFISAALEYQVNSEKNARTLSPHYTYYQERLIVLKQTDLSHHTMCAGCHNWLSGVLVCRKKQPFVISCSLPLPTSDLNFQKIRIGGN